LIVSEQWDLRALRALARRTLAQGAVQAAAAGRSDTRRRRERRSVISVVCILATHHSEGVQCCGAAPSSLGKATLRRTCGADRDRTDDLRLAKPALSQLSYSPENLRNRLGSVTLKSQVAAEGTRAGRRVPARPESSGPGQT
jgi:hypothetical protein